MSILHSSIYQKAFQQYLRKGVSIEAYLPEKEEQLEEVIYQWANPLLTQPITPQQIMLLIATLAK